jgi:hypothetical protein
MTQVACTIIQNGRSDPYGNALIVGASYTGTLEYVRSLVQTGYATVAS